MSKRPARHVPHPRIAAPWRVVIHQLYYGDTPGARRFRIGLLALDVVVIIYFIVSSMIDPQPGSNVVDYLIALVLVIELVARWSIANNPWRFIIRFGTIIDIVVVVSMTLPLLTENLAFLRVVRMLRLMRSYHLLRQLRETSAWFRRNEETVHSAVNLIVFVFIVTAVVFVVEEYHNPNINNYVDALYFTVTTLTTTGFGDITMEGTAGRLLAVLIMVFGVALFLRLVQTIFRPNKIHNECAKCGLDRHEADAVHCKRCGAILEYHGGELDWSRE